MSGYRGSVYAFRIIAAVTTPTVTSIDITTVTQNTSKLLTVTGSNFDSAIQVRLVQGTKYFCPTKVTWVNAGQIKLNFTFNPHSSPFLSQSEGNNWLAHAVWIDEHRRAQAQGCQEGRRPGVRPA